MVQIPVIGGNCDFAGRMIEDPGGALRQNQCGLNFQELRNSRQTIETPAGRQYVLTFICIGTDNEELVRCRAQDQQLGVYPLFRNTPVSRMTLNKIGHETWEVIAEYNFKGALPGSENPGIPGSIAFSTTGGSQTITQSIASEAQVYEDDRAIGFDGKQVNGVDVVVPKTRWSEVWLFDMQEVFNLKSPGDPTYEVIPEDSLTPCTNSAVTIPNTLFHKWRYATGSISKEVGEPEDPDYYDGSFRGNEVGEVLFLGVTARNVSHYRLECTFEFQFARNRHFCFTHVDPDDESQTKSLLVFAKGFDYIEYRWAKKGFDATSGTGGRKEKRALPTECIVHQLYPEFDFRELEIDVAPMQIPIAGDSIFYDIPDCSYNSPPVTGHGEKAGLGWDNAACDSAPG